MHHDMDLSLSSCGAFILHKILFSENSNMRVHMSGPEDRDEQKLELKGSHSSASPSSVSPILIKYVT